MVPSKILVFVLIFGFVQFISGPRGAVKAQDDDDATSDTKEKIMSILNGDGDKADKMKKALAVFRDTIDAMNMLMDMMDDDGNLDTTGNPFGEPAGDLSENPLKDAGITKNIPDATLPTVAVPSDMDSEEISSLPPITTPDIPEITPSLPKLPNHLGHKLPGILPRPTIPVPNAPAVPSAPSPLGPDPNVPDPNVPAVPSAPSPLGADPSVPDADVPVPSDSSPLGTLQAGPDPNAPDASVPDPNVPAVPSASSPISSGPNVPAPNGPNPNVPSLNGAKPKGGNLGGQRGKGGRRGRYVPRNAQRSAK